MLMEIQKKRIPVALYPYAFFTSVFSSSIMQAFVLDGLDVRDGVVFEQLALLVQRKSPHALAWIAPDSPILPPKARDRQIAD